MSGRKESILLFFAIALVCSALDLATKSLVIERVRASDGIIVLVPGYLRFIDRLNQGGVWSSLQWLGDSANSLLLWCSATAAVVIAVFACTKLRSHGWPVALVLGMIEGGALGNLHDRYHFGGVRDFIDAHYHDVYHWPTFNLADSFLVVGMICILFGPLLGWGAPEAKQPAEAAAPLAG